MVSNSWATTCISGDPWWKHFDIRLLHRKRGGLSNLSTNCWLCISSMRWCSSIDFRCSRFRYSCYPWKMENSRALNLIGNRLIRGANLWSWKKCLLVWFSIRHLENKIVSEWPKCDCSTSYFSRSGGCCMGNIKPISWSSWSWSNGL